MVGLTSKTSSRIDIAVVIIPVMSDSGNTIIVAYPIPNTVNTRESHQATLAPLHRKMTKTIVVIVPPICEALSVPERSSDALTNSSNPTIRVMNANNDFRPDFRFSSE